MKKLLIYIPLLFAFAACEVVLDVEVPEQDPKLVLNSFLNPDSTILVDLSQDAYILSENEFTQISGASLQLFENGNAVSFFEEQEDGIYRANLQPSPGNTYRISASKSGFEDVSATFTLPSQGASFVTTDMRVSNKSGYEQLVWEIEIDDPASEDNYYEVMVEEAYVNYHIDLIYDEMNDTYYEDTVAIDTMYYADYIELDQGEFEDDPTRWGQSVLINDKTFDGQRYKLKVYVDYYYYEGETHKKRMTIRSCHKDYFNYQRSTRIQEWNDGDPFSQPVFVTSNIEGGYGIFSGFISSSIEEEIEIQ